MLPSFLRPPSSFKRTRRAIANAQTTGLPLQINTTECAANAERLEAMVPLLSDGRGPHTGG